jgi:hypothetical protein
MGAIQDIWQSGLEGLKSGFRSGLVGAVSNTTTGREIEREAIRQKIMSWLSNPLIIGGLILGFYIIFLKRR